MLDGHHTKEFLFIALLKYDPIVTDPISKFYVKPKKKTYRININVYVDHDKNNNRIPIANFANHCKCNCKPTQSKSCLHKSSDSTKSCWYKIA